MAGNLKNIIGQLKTNNPKSLGEWRQWSEKEVFIAALIFMPVSMLFSLPTYITENHYGLIIFNLLIMIVLLIRLTNKWGSHRFWTIIWLLLIYIMMITFFITLGPHYARSSWLVFFSVMTALFLGTMAGAVAVLVNMGMLMCLYFIIRPENTAWALVYQDPFPKYMMFIINTSAVTLLPTLMTGFMLDRLDKTHDFQQQIMNDLLENNEKLKLAEETIKESEIRYRTLFESAGDALFVMKGKNFTECNQKTLEMFECRADEILGHSPVEFSPPVQPDGRNSEEKAMEKINAALGGNRQVFEWQHKKLDNTLFLTEVSLNHTKLFAEDSILAIVRDITSRKKAEEALRESESYNKVLFRNSRIPLIVMDPETNKYTDCNQAAIDIYGYKSREETLSKTPLDVSAAFQYNGEPSSEAVGKKLSEVIEKGSILFEWRHQRPNGEIWDAEVHLMSFEHKNSKLLQFSLLDITERKKAENMMVQSEKMLSVGGLAAGMAHEINNPLAGILQTSHVISNRLTDTEMPANKKIAEEVGITMNDIRAFMEKRKIPLMVETIVESGHRIAEIVDNMLSFARKSDSSATAHNLAELFDKILELAATDYNLKKQYDFKSIEIIKEYEKNLPMVPCEGAKIQQVIFNILSNGAHAMQEAMKKNNKYRPKFILRLFEEKRTNMMCIEIEDNGPGMGEKTRKRIFEPFFTTKPVGIGTGLGLSVSYFIITENHGGEMTVESNPGSGAKFIIRLPLKKN